MAITERWFSTTSNGAADGTSWENRAALFSDGNWSTVITGFDFTSNSMVAYVGPGTYTCAQLLQTSLFSVAEPRVSAPLVVVACDSSGVLLPIPDPGWVAAQPVWSLTNVPVIATTTNITTSNHANTCWRNIKFAASGRNGSMLTGGSFDWCVLVNSASGTSAVGISGTSSRVSNCTIQMSSGTSYNCAISTIGMLRNCRCEGNTSASLGSRQGVAHAATAAPVDGLVCLGFPGGGLVSASSSTTQSITLKNFVLANNAGGGYIGHSTASQTVIQTVVNGIICDNGTTGTVYGLDASAENVYAANLHLRDNYTANFNGMGNWPTSLCDTGTSYGASQSARQSALFVDWASGVPANMDVRIKNTSAYWGKGYGAGDQPAAGGGGRPAAGMMGGQLQCA